MCATCFDPKNDEVYAHARSTSSVRLSGDESAMYHPPPSPSPTLEKIFLVKDLQVGNIKFTTFTSLKGCLKPS